MVRVCLEPSSRSLKFCVAITLRNLFKPEQLTYRYHITPERRLGFGIGHRFEFEGGEN